MKSFRLFLISLFLVLLSCCRQQVADVSSAQGSTAAKGLLQGIWIDDETEDVVFRVSGDTVYYADTVSQPAYFKIVDDTLVLGHTHYYILKQAEHIFWFRNQTNDLVKLHKSEDPADSIYFARQRPQILPSIEKVEKSDTVVFYRGERYHCYIAINPTKYRVVSKSSYTHDGVEVENIYYDNIIHISVFHGKNQLFSSDFKKQMYADNVPDNFLSRAVLGNMTFSHIDEKGFHFHATLCVPDGAACYMVSTDIGFDGQLTMELLDY